MILAYQDAHYVQNRDGSVRELFVFSLPLILSFLSQSLMLFCDRLLLSRHSLHSLEVTTAAQALAMLFQIPCMRLVSISQVFVGQYYGGGKLHLIGPAIWQMIWFSFLSMVAILPAGYIAQHFFFAQSTIPEGIQYFEIQLWTNFLFPLSWALSCFYLGIGKSRIIIIVNNYNIT